MKADYAVLISLINNDNEPLSILLSAVEATNISATSVVTQHPTVDGSFIGDHMYKMPVDVSLRGTFSLNGDKSFVIKNSETKELLFDSISSLARVEAFFESIKNDGLFCTITKIRVDQNHNAQFALRENMVLKSINWVENINSLDFNFSFQEVIRAEVQIVDVDPDDRFAPDIEYPEASNFSDTLLDWTAVDREVLQALKDFDLIADDFIEYIATLGVGSLVAIGIGAAVAAAFASTIVALGLSVPVVGAVIAAATALIIGIYALVRYIKKTVYRIKAFTYYKNPKKRDKETERFVNFYDDIHKQIASLDGVIKCYTITENKPQETILSIGGDYYIFNFEKNNIDDGSSYAYKLNISDINSSLVADVNTNYVVDSFSDGTPQNAIANISGYYVYLIKAPKSDFAYDDLTNYIICCSQINPQEFSTILTKIIQEAIKY